MNNLENTLIKNAFQKSIIELENTFSNKDFYNEFIKNLLIKKIIENNVYIIVENSFAKKVLNDEVKPLMEKSFYFYLNLSLSVFFLSEEELNNIPKEIIKQNTSINKNYTFDNFYVYNFNRSVSIAAKNINNNFINPLFICGGVGLGKTHILHAIGNLYLSENKFKNVKYISADDFSREIYNGISSNDKLLIEQIKNEYEKIDLLLVDDVQMLEKRDKINEVMFGIFNNNISKGRFVVWASDKDPDLLTGFQDRIKSRFKSGLYVFINNPDRPTLKNIIKTKAENLNLNINQEGIDFLANRNMGDIRRVEGELNQLSFYLQSLNDSKMFVNLELVKLLFSPTNLKEIKMYGCDIDPNIVISQVCSAYNVKEELVKSKSRQAFLTAPRSVCMYILREKFNMTYSQIGQCFSGRNHSSVMEAIEKVNNLIEKDENLDSFIKNISSKL